MGDQTRLVLAGHCLVAVETLKLSIFSRKDDINDV